MNFWKKEVIFGSGLRIRGFGFSGKVMIFSGKCGRCEKGGIFGMIERGRKERGLIDARNRKRMDACVI